MAANVDRERFARHLSRAVGAVLPAAVLLCGLDALGVWSSAPTQSALNPIIEVLGIAGYTLLFFLAAGAVFSCALAVVSWAVALALRAKLLGSSFVTGTVAPAGLAAVALLLFGLERAALLVSGFGNRELGALLLALVGLALVIVSAALFLGLATAFVRASSPTRLLRVLVATVPLGSVLLLLGWHNAAGLEVLGPWLSGPPIAAGLVLVVVWLRSSRLEARRHQRRLRYAVVCLVVSLVASAVLGHTSDRWVSLATGGGLWSSRLMGVARCVSDWDRDGHSSHFGGGDCKPFDASVHPGAEEVPGDGIDNNCLGGDRAEQAEVRGPEWYAGGPVVDNLIVVTVEAIRPDYTSLFGERDTTPNLARLSRECQVFERFYASTPNTWPSLIDLWSSRLPTETSWDGHSPAASTPWVPSLLQAEGFTTMGVLGSYESFQESSPLRFQRGFDVWDVTTDVPQQGAHFRGFTAATQLDIATRLLHEHSDDGRFLLWLHLFEPHASYEQYPGAPVYGQSDSDRYASEIWGVDHELGRFVEQLRAEGLLENTALVIVGEHGEAFGEHGDTYHASSLYDEQVRTLGVVCVPGLPGRRLGQPASLHDLPSTLLNLLGVTRAFETLRGRNLVPYLRGAAPSPSYVILEMGFGVAVVDWPHKLILDLQTQTGELYDLESDPGELDNLIDVSPQVRDRLFGYVVEHLEQGR